MNVRLSWRGDGHQEVQPDNKIVGFKNHKEVQGLYLYQLDDGKSIRC